MRSKGSTPVGFLRGQPDAPRERGRPARILSPPPRLSTLPADAASVEAGGEPWPGSRLIRAGGVGPGCARTGAGGTPALPGGDCSHPSCSSRGGRTGLPGRRPAHAAEPSRLVTLRGFLFSAFVDNPQLFQTSPAPALPGRSYESETIRTIPSRPWYPVAVHLNALVALRRSSWPFVDNSFFFCLFSFVSSKPLPDHDVAGMNRLAW